MCKAINYSYALQARGQEINKKERKIFINNCINQVLVLETYPKL